MIVLSYMKSTFGNIKNDKLFNGLSREYISTTCAAFK